MSERNSQKIWYIPTKTDLEVRFRGVASIWWIVDEKADWKFYTKKKLIQGSKGWVLKKKNAKSARKDWKMDPCGPSPMDFEAEAPCL